MWFAYITSYSGNITMNPLHQEI
uniref:Uncharacterized protein n=1 Tax=Anguilla anguilla TaxID=7936 RepID=A0A0E9XV07_ANGAN